MEMFSTGGVARPAACENDSFFLSMYVVYTGEQVINDVFAILTDSI